MNDQRYDVAGDPHADDRMPANGQGRLRAHALFPRAPGSGPETRDIQAIGLQRRLPPAEARRVGHKIEYCPVDIPADELPDWGAIHARFGGGQYKVCAKDGDRHILCWSPVGEGNWYYMAGRSKPFSEAEDDIDDDDAAAAPAPVARAPREPEQKSEIGAILMALAQMQQTSADRQMQVQQEAADRQMQMLLKMSEQTTQLLAALLNRPDPSQHLSEQTNQMFLALLNRPDPTRELIATLLNRTAAPASAAPVIDPFAGVKLGAELKGGVQPAVAAAAADPIAQMRGTIELVKEMQGLAPAGGGGAADAAEVSSIFSGLNSLVNGLKTNSAPAAEPAPAAQTRVLINGRYLTAEQAALEYSRLSAGPPVVPMAPVIAAAPVAPVAVAAPAPAQVIASAAPLAPFVPAVAPVIPVEQVSPSATSQSDLEIDALLARMRDPAIAAKLQARIAGAQAGAPSPSTPASAAPVSPAPSNITSPNTAASPSAALSNAAPSNAVPVSAVPPQAARPSTSSSSTTEALAAMPPELVGHVANLDPGQFVALAKMHPAAIAHSVRGLQGMDDEKAKMFGEAIGNLPAEALPLLSKALPAEARKFLGGAS